MGDSNCLVFKRRHCAAHRPKYQPHTAFVGSGFPTTAFHDDAIPMVSAPISKSAIRLGSLRTSAQVRNLVSAYYFSPRGPLFRHVFSRCAESAVSHGREMLFCRDLPSVIWKIVPDFLWSTAIHHRFGIKRVAWGQSNASAQTPSLHTFHSLTRAFRGVRACVQS